MSKEEYLQLKKELKIRFMLNILIALIATVFYIQMVVNHSRYMVYVLISIGALSLMNQFLILPVYNAKKEAELEHPEWKTLPTKGVEIPQEEAGKRNMIALLALALVVVGFHFFYHPISKMDTESNLIEDSRDVESVLERRTEESEEYESSSVVEKEEQGSRDDQENGRSNEGSTESNLDIDKAHDFAEKAQQENWLRGGE